MLLPCYSNHSLFLLQTLAFVFFAAFFIIVLLFHFVAFLHLQQLVFVILLPGFPLTAASLTLSVYAFNLWKEISKFLFRIRYQLGFLKCTYLSTVFLKCISQQQLFDFNFLALWKEISNLLFCKKHQVRLRLEKM